MTQLLINALIAGSFAALMASGLALVYGTLGVFNMALGQTALMGGYVTWWASTSLGLSFPIALLIGMVAAGFVTWLSFEFFVEPFFRRHRFLPLVTTIALSMILDGAILLLFEERPRSIQFLNAEPVTIAGATLSLEQIVLIICTLIFLSLTAWVLTATSLGRKIRATVLHAHAAESLGIPSGLLYRITFILSGVLAGLAGVYQGIDQNLTPVLGFSITIKAYAAVIAGGKGSLKGAVIAAYAIALLEQLVIGVPWFAGTYISAGYQSTVAMVVIIAFLLFRPQGLFGSTTRST
ncbi:MAG: branched-chain amino acid ABC transporter permease [Candidatus Peribacteraceae bacterium]